MGRGLPSLDKVGMPGSVPGPRRGWLEEVRDQQSVARRTTPSSSEEGSSNPPAPKVLSSYELSLIFIRRNTILLADVRRV